MGPAGAEPWQTREAGGPVEVSGEEELVTPTGGSNRGAAHDGRSDEEEGLSSANGLGWAPD